jgi:hypothetical protein
MQRDATTSPLRKSRKERGTLNLFSLAKARATRPYNFIFDGKQNGPLFQNSGPRVVIWQYQAT